MSIFERLADIRTDDLPEEDCLVQAAWVFHGASSIDSFDKITCPPNRYAFYLTLTAGGLGCCYSEQDLSTQPSPEWIGRDARTIRAPSIAFRVSLLDAVFANFRREPEARIVISGSPREKSGQRAAIIAAEIARVAVSAKLPRRRVVMIGVVGKVMSALSERGMRVQGIDLNPAIVGKDSGGAEVLDTSQTPKAIASSDIALVTGMTLANSTLDRIVDLCGASGVPVVMYAQTGSYFGPFYTDLGIRAVISESFPIYTLPGPSEVRVYR
jgi:uncharacterized UPF0146 family protein